MTKDKAWLPHDVFLCLLPPNKNISPSNSWYLDSIQTVVLTVQIYWTNAAWITCIQLEMLLLKAQKWLWTDFTSTLPSTSNLCSILVQFLSQVKNVYSWWIEMYRFWSKLIQNKYLVISKFGGRRICVLALTVFFNFTLEVKITSVTTDYECESVILQLNVLMFSWSALYL